MQFIRSRLRRQKKLHQVKVETVRNVQGMIFIQDISHNRTRLKILGSILGGAGRLHLDCVLVTADSKNRAESPRNLDCSFSF